MDGFILSNLPEANKDGQQVSVSYNGSKPLVELKTELGTTISLTPHATKPWFKLCDGASDRMYGHWQNTPGINPFEIQQTGRIISVTTEDGQNISTLNNIRGPEPAKVAPMMPTKPGHLGELIGALISYSLRHNEKAVDTALEDLAPTKPAASIGTGVLLNKKFN